jgi:Family of unknown function (DUF5681)
MTSKHNEADDAAYEDPRCANGKFRKGHSGNPKGRPPKEKRAFTGRQLTADVLLAMEEEMAMTEQGKRKKLPIILFIYKQLLRLAANGNERCMFKAIDLRKQLLAESDSALLSMVETMIKYEKEYKEDPEEFTDEQIALLEHMRRRFSDPYSIN